MPTSSGRWSTVLLVGKAAAGLAVDFHLSANRRRPAAAGLASPAQSPDLRPGALSHGLGDLSAGVGLISARCVAIHR